MVFGLLKAIYHALCGHPKPEQPPAQQHHQKPPHHQQQQNQWQQQQQARYPPQQVPHKPPHGVTHGHGQQSAGQSRPPKKYYNDNEVNSNNDHYKSLRARANEEGDKMARSFSQSHDAYNRGDHAAAKEFSNMGKEHQRRMEQLNKEASDWIYRDRFSERDFQDSAADEIDLHGLYVKEALARTEQALENARRNGQSEVKLIVGKGLHSSSGAKIKPAIEDLMRKYQLDAEIDPSNAGVLVVRMNTGGRSRMSPGEITRRIEREEEGCAIM
ncbi:hypothetical protein NMY22_g9085 [Coprinellus aureogranulatus]|nr:hypothetical protein NMY22_g9085 [Coprinellus aureogranulatus]